MSRQFLKYVTVTGADDTIKPEELVAIQKRFPFAEFGILMHESSTYGTGLSRFPSASWLQKLCDVACRTPLNLSGHLCGHWVRQAFLGNWPDFGKIDNRFQKRFGRWQLNTHAEPVDFSPVHFDSVLWPINTMGQKVIFQLDGVNDEKAETMLARGHKNLMGLFDLSHGAGRLPSSWPIPLDGMICGYAGGLSPDNVAEQLCGIQKAVKDLRRMEFLASWIDAETKLRNDKDVFDLEKVVKFLESAEPWVIR